MQYPYKFQQNPKRCNIVGRFYDPEKNQMYAIAFSPTSEAEASNQQNNNNILSRTYSGQMLFCCCCWQMHCSVNPLLPSALYLLLQMLTLWYQLKL